MLCAWVILLVCIKGNHHPLVIHVPFGVANVLFALCPRMFDHAC